MQSPVRKVMCTESCVQSPVRNNDESTLSKFWPRVVADVCLNNRVHKTDQLFHGKPRDVMKWLGSHTKQECDHGIQGGRH